MSPIKRAFSDHFGEGCTSKRLRGGGYDDDDHSPTFQAEDELFDDDLIAAVPDEEIPEEALEEVKAKIPVKDQQRWKRPDVRSDLSSAVDLSMQWIDMDVVVGKPLEKNPNPSKKEVLGSKEGQVPVLRCYGVDEQGHSVAAFLHGFTPYAYFALPARASLDKSDAALAEIRSVIDVRLRDAARGVAQNAPAVLGVSLVKDHQSIFGYESPHTQFLKVYVALPGLLAPLKRIMEDGIKLPSISNSQDSYAPFECNVPFVLRFMVDRGITGAGWLTFPSNTYTIRVARDKETNCQVRLHDDFISWFDLQKKIVFPNLTCLVLHRQTDRGGYFIRRHCVSKVRRRIQ